MLQRKQVLATLCGLLFALCCTAQTAKRTPIPVEVNIGNNRYGLLFVMNERFVPDSKFSFLTITSFESDYKNSENNLDFITKSQVSYNIYKGFGIAAGLSVNSAAGLSPVAGLQYVYATKKLLVVVTPTIGLSHGQNLQGLTILEYKPSLTNKVNLYSRFQAFYSQNTKAGHHDRSYMQFRLGVGIKSYQFGLASTYDYYGPAKFLKDNHGVFVRYNFM